MSSLVFQKTESGKSEIAQRKAGLSPATHSVLIMVNGGESANALAARGLPQLQGRLDTLLALGLIEPVPTTRTPPGPRHGEPATASAKVAQVAAQVAPPSTPASPEPDLEPLRRRAMLQLTPHFGPDTPVVAQALLAARTAAAFNEALDGIQTPLAMYLERKQASRELQDLRPTP
ncbi:MAG: hypothetical protein K2X51_13165 [Burkholderiales bacterium]|nr:hypothetical protein [Burkholderiales bacterium]